MSAPRLRLSVLLFAAMSAGCGPGPRSEETWRDAGFARHLPADTEAFVSLHGPADRWTAVASAWTPLLKDPGLREAWLRAPAARIAEPFWSAPALPSLWQALGSAFDEEIFVSFGPGTASQLAALQQVKRLFEAARVRNLFTPVPDAGLVPPANDLAAELPDNLAEAAFTEVMIPLPPAMQEALENFVRNAAIPPIVVGMKLPADDRRLPVLLGDWVEGLPEKIPRDKFTAGDHGEFTRVRLPLMSIVPREAAVRARDILGANIGDPYAATYIIRDLMGKTTTLCFGQAHEYFLVTVGMDDPRDALAPVFAESLPAKGAFDRLAPLLGPDKFAALVYADPLIVSLAAAPPPVGEYLDAALESALEFAPGEQIRALRSAATPLREQAEALFHPRVAALGGVVREAEGQWKAELFGGSFAPRLALKNARPLLGADPRMAVLWTEHWEADYAVRVARFAAGVSAFAEKWLEALGPVFLQDGERDRYGRTLGLISAALQPFGGEAAGWLEKTFDHDVALAVSLDGVMPQAPFAPTSAAEAVLPRAAVAAGLRDREALGELRAGITGDGALPLFTPVGSHEDSGATTYAYPVPMAGPDVAPAVTVDSRRCVLGTSPSFSAAVAGAPDSARGHSSVQSILVSTAPMAAFAEAWANALEEDGNLSGLTLGLIPSEPSVLRAFVAMLKTPRHFTYEARWEDEVLHRILELKAAP